MSRGRGVHIDYHAIYIYIYIKANRTRRGYSTLLYIYTHIVMYEKVIQNIYWLIGV